MKKVLFNFAFFFFIITVKAQLLTPEIDSIPMRDGKKLAADIYIPNSVSSGPVILIQTPYNRALYRNSLPLGVGIQLNSSHYIFVIVDWRGFYGSASAMVANPNRGQDGYDVVEWIATQAWSNGKIGTWGPSALGKIQYQTAKENPPHLSCIAPVVGAPQFDYQEYYPGGVYRTEYVQQLDQLGYGLSTFILANPFFNNTWTYVQNQNNYPTSIKVPALMIGGWYDHNIDLMLRFFEGIQTQSPVNVRNQHKMLIGPWAHGGFGLVQVGSCQQGDILYNEACRWSDSIAIRFFDAHLRDIDNNWATEPPVHYFQMGENTWKSLPSWNVNSLQKTKFYLHADHLLKTEMPTQNNTFLEYSYDPRNPSPTIGGPTLAQNLLQGPYDQSQLVENRNDVLVFSTPVLAQDMVIKGNAKVVLHVSSDRLDTDFAIRLTDVYPDGKSMIFADGIKRMRFRNGYRTTDTASMVPGNMYTIEVELPNTAITIKSGHRLRIIVSSSNYPRFDRNLNNGGNMYTAGDTLVANNKIFLNQNNASYLEIYADNFVASVNEIENPDFRIFPNPSNGNVWIESNHENQIINVYNLQGQLLKSFEVKQKREEINLSDLPNAYYILSSKFTKSKLLIIK